MFLEDTACHTWALYIQHCISNFPSQCHNQARHAPHISDTEIYILGHIVQTCMAYYIFFL